MDDYIVYAKTQGSYEIVKLIDMLKEILDEGKFDFIRDPNQDANMKENELRKLKELASKNSKSDKSDADTDEESDDSADEAETDKKKKKNKRSSEGDSDAESDDEKPKKMKGKLSKKKKEEETDSEQDEEKPKKHKKTKKGKEEPEEKKEEQKQPEKKKNPGGIRIIALDKHRTLLIYIKLSADEFDEFYVRPKVMYSVGLDLIQLHKFMKTVDKESVMTMKISREDEQMIQFELENNAKSNLNTYSQKVLDIDDDQTKLPQDTSFEMSVAIDTSEFRKICQDMSQFAEYVEITCTAKEITFRCKGDSNHFVKTFKHSDKGGVRIMCLDKEHKKGLVMVQAIYNLKHLVTFGKCVNLCTEMQLFLKNDYPLFINYPIGNIGKMLVGLSPVDEKTIQRDAADYDEADDKYYGSKKPVMREV